MRMGWTFEYLADRQIVLLRTTGPQGAATGREQFKELMAFAAEHHAHKFLVDHRAAEVKYDTVEVFDLPALYRESGVGHDVKAAIVFAELNENRRFYETVCRNRGFNVSVFDDYDAALKWLED
jgi:hypothetical protein